VGEGRDARLPGWRRCRRAKKRVQFPGREGRRPYSRQAHRRLRVSEGQVGHDERASETAGLELLRAGPGHRHQDHL